MLHAIAGSPRRVVLVLTLLAALLVPGTAALAAYLQSISADAELTGAVDVAQGPDPADQHAAPEDRRVLAAPAGTEEHPVATLYREPTGDPPQRTASYALTLQTRAGSAAADAALTPARPGGVSDGTWSALRVGVYAEGAPLLPGGVPVQPDRLAASGGVALPRLPADGGGSAVVEVRVWLAPDAPREAYLAGFPLDLDVVGETTAGERFSTEVEFS